MADRRNHSSAFSSAHLQSLTHTNPSLALSEDQQILSVIPSASPSKVALIAGPFSPFWSATCFAPLVGAGLLSAVVAPTQNATVKYGVSGLIRFEFDAEKFDEAARVSGKTDALFVQPNWGRLDAVKSAETSTALAGDGKAVMAIGDDVEIPRWDLEIGGERAGGAGTVLVMKICGALAAMGYELAVLQQVGKLVVRNLVSMNVVVCDHQPWDEHRVQLASLDFYDDKAGAMGAEQLTVTVANMLRMMLDPGDKERSFVHVNSNEVVLMINNLGGLSSADLGIVTTEVVNQIHKKWNIWPVRIYAGSFMESWTDRGFSISILNVVNTDIGGPSMVQLLDAPCEAQGWHAFVRKETWDGRNMLAREEKETTQIISTPDLLSSHLNEKPPAAEETTKAEEEGASVLPPTEIVGADEDTATQVVPPVSESEQMTLEEATRKSPTQSHQGEIEEEVVRDPEISASPEDKSKESNVESEVVGVPSDEEDISGDSLIPEDLPPRPDIQYPTFQHADADESLLDLVRRHAQKLNISSGESSEKAGDESTAAEPKKLELTSEKPVDVGPVMEWNKFETPEEKGEQAEESLLDLIRRQAQKLGISTPEKEEKAAASSEPEKAELSGEEDYEIVEKGAGT